MFGSLGSRNHFDLRNNNICYRMIYRRSGNVDSNQRYEFLVIFFLIILEKAEKFTEKFITLDGINVSLDSQFYAPPNKNNFNTLCSSCQCQSLMVAGRPNFTTPNWPVPINLCLFIFIYFLNRNKNWKILPLFFLSCLFVSFLL